MKYLGSALIGFLIGLGFCYWKAITAVYQKRDLISSGSTLIDSAQDFASQVRKL